MSVRARMAIAFLIVAVPASALLVWGAWSARRSGALGAARAAIVERMESGARERCEARPERFSLGHPHRHRGAMVPRGRVLAYDARLEPSAPGIPPLDAQARAALEAGDDVVELETGGAPALALRMPWSEGRCVVLVVRGRAARPALMERLLGREIAIAAVVLGLAFAVAWLALGPPLSRLRRLADAVRASRGVGFEIPRGVEGGDEVGSVARALADAARRIREHVERLEARDRALTAYVDATTHDLAIPLTVIQSRLAEIDARARAGEPLDPRALEPLMAEHEYLGQLVSNMAAAARFASGQPRVERHPVDLRAVVERVVARHAPIARASRVALEHAVPERPVVIEGDDILVERALSNLVHNAIRHGARDAEGHVAVTLDARHGGGFRLAVADDGADADIARIERALNGTDVAGPDANARTRGLGLRIVRAVAEAHRWTITVGKNEEGGLEIALRN